MDRRQQATRGMLEKLEWIASESEPRERVVLLLGWKPRWHVDQLEKRHRLRLRWVASRRRLRWAAASVSFRRSGSALLEDELGAAVAGQAAVAGASARWGQERLLQ